MTANYLRAMLDGGTAQQCEAALTDGDRYERNDPQHLQDGIAKKKEYGSAHFQSIVEDAYKCEKHKGHQCFIPTPKDSKDFARAHIRIDFQTQKNIQVFMVCLLSHPISITEHFAVS